MLATVLAQVCLLVGWHYSLVFCYVVISVGCLMLVVGGCGVIGCFDVIPCLPAVRRSDVVQSAAYVCLLVVCHSPIQSPWLAVCSFGAFASDSLQLLPYVCFWWICCVVVVIVSDAVMTL